MLGTMTRTRSFVAALLSLSVMVPLFAQEGDGDLELSFEGPRIYGPGIPAGLDLSLTYHGLALSEAADTLVYLKFGGGYEDSLLARDPLTGDPGPVIEFDTPNFQWDLAFIQGLARRDDGDNLIEAFAYYRGRWDIHPNEGVCDDTFSDVCGLFGTSFMAGLSYDTSALVDHRYKTGAYAEATAEWGPAFLNADTDFWRVSAQASGYLPVLDLPREGEPLLGAYLAGFAGIDFADGGSVPIYVNQSFGGRELRDSLGDCVRGYGSNAYDASFKAVANVELRLVGPALGRASALPFLFGFFDAGYYSGFSAAASMYDASGFIASAGGGAALGLFDYAHVGVELGTRLVEDDIGYTYDYDRFFWSVMLFLHF